MFRCPTCYPHPDIVHRYRSSPLHLLLVEGTDMSRYLLHEPRGCLTSGAVFGTVEGVGLWVHGEFVQFYTKIYWYNVASRRNRTCSLALCDIPTPISSTDTVPYPYAPCWWKERICHDTYCTNPVVAPLQEQSLESLKMLVLGLLWC